MRAIWTAAALTAALSLTTVTAMSANAAGALASRPTAVAAQSTSAHAAQPALSVQDVLAAQLGRPGDSRVGVLDQAATLSNLGSATSSRRSPTW